MKSHFNIIVSRLHCFFSFFFCCTTEYSIVRMASKKRMNCKYDKNLLSASLRWLSFKCVYVVLVFFANGLYSYCLKGVYVKTVKEHERKIETDSLRSHRLNDAHVYTYIGWQLRERETFHILYVVISLVVFFYSQIRISFEAHVIL